MHAFRDAFIKYRRFNSKFWIVIKINKELYDLESDSLRPQVKK
jgi:hypothetical protein